MADKKIKWITFTALFLALLIVVQLTTRGVSQLITGSLVNLLLITSALTVGRLSGITVAALSPFFAFLLGVGPAFPIIIPLIVLGNIVIVLVTGAIIKHGLDNKNAKKVLTGVIGVVAGALSKFLVLYIGIVKIALTLIPGIKPQQVKLLTTAFSTPQLLTALIGGLLALIIVPMLRRAVKFGN